ncbi:anthranilate phosphoribosyltransferase, partial [Romeria aff. gracilis LEGE 07310]
PPPTTHNPSTQVWSALLQQLLDRQSLSVEQAAALMQAWLRTEIAPELSGAILGVLQAKGVSASELVGMVQVLRSHASPSQPRPDKAAPLIDTCGTGGDGASTFNISTAVAFVAAAAGLQVAKHGNRSASSQAGSADVLEALGINLTAHPDQVAEAVEAVGITFLYAPAWHPAFKAVAPLRKSLKIRTIFNLLGPLLNPMQPTGQVIGVYDPTLIETIAIALSQLGSRRAVVVHGRENLDEAGLADFSELAIVTNSQIRMMAISPQMLGLAAAPTEALRGGDVKTNADILKAVLQGKGTQAQQQVVALNTALALIVGEALPARLSEVDALKQGLAIAQEILNSGTAWAKLEQLSQFLH